MKKLIVLLLLGAAFWQLYLKAPDSPIITNIAADGSLLSRPVVIRPATSSYSQGGSASTRTLSTTPPPAAHYRCDGRTHCSQMRSCEEATFFLRNCPGTQMDGNNDGVPCERQWCR